MHIAKLFTKSIPIMSTTHSSKACCKIPPVQIKGYSAKGKYLGWDGHQIFVTGDESATKAIFYIYDIFGYTPQTLQGADIIAKAGNYLVIMPDFFRGKPAQASWYASDSPENAKKKADFMGFLSLFQNEIKSLFGHAHKTFPRVSDWGAIGYCWGGKVVVVNSGPDPLWKVAIQSSPAKVDPSDAAKLTIPFATLASEDEPADKVKEFGEAQKTPKLVQTYDNQIHGFMSAR